MRARSALFQSRGRRAPSHVSIYRPVGLVLNRAWSLSTQMNAPEIQQATAKCSDLCLGRGSGVEPLLGRSGERRRAARRPPAPRPRRACGGSRPPPSPTTPSRRGGPRASTPRGGASAQAAARALGPGPWWWRSRPRPLGDVAPLERKEGAQSVRSGAPPQCAGPSAVPTGFRPLAAVAHNLVRCSGARRGSAPQGS